MNRMGGEMMYNNAGTYRTYEMRVLTSCQLLSARLGEGFGAGEPSRERGLTGGSSQIWMSVYRVFFTTPWPFGSRTPTA